MSYHLTADEPVAEGVKRIVHEELDRAIDHVDDDELARHETVHEVRKRCKEIRAVLRLVRPELGETYSEENAWFRDAARTLSRTRDAQALIETFDEGLDDDLAAARETLLERRRRIMTEEIALEDRLATVQAVLREAHGRVDSWPIDAAGFDAVAGGIAKSYRRGREAMDGAYHNPTAERFHEWRKRVKYHRYHMRLVRESWHEPLQARRDELKVLSDRLGDEYDLAVFAELLGEDPDLFDDRGLVRTLHDCIDRRRAELQAAAEPLGKRVYVEPPTQLLGRLEGYWQAWELEAKPALAANEPTG